MSEWVLELEGVSKGYNQGKPSEISVLHDLAMTIAPGELVALVAPSGAGKSTLLHIAGLLDQPDSGSVRIEGRDMTRADDRSRTAVRRASVGFVYQFHHLLPEFTATENIVLPQLANGISRAAADERAAALLDSMGLSDRATHRPAALSGGQQQRVAFCRALANAPRLLLADEPTGNLDSESAEQLFRLLLSIARASGLAALIATHNLELAERMDRIVRMRDGRIM